MNASLISQHILDLSVPWIAMIAIGGCVLVSIISRLISHQQKMTEIIHRQHEQKGLAEQLHALQAHVADLTEKVNRQALPPDDSRSSSRD